MEDSIELIRASKQYDGWDPSSIFGSASSRSSRVGSSSSASSRVNNDLLVNDSLMFVGSQVHADEIARQDLSTATMDSNLDIARQRQATSKASAKSNRIKDQSQHDRNLSIISSRLEQASSRGGSRSITRTDQSEITNQPIDHLDDSLDVSSAQNVHNDGISSLRNPINGTTELPAVSSFVAHDDQALDEISSVTIPKEDISSSPREVHHQTDEFMDSLNSLSGQTPTGDESIGVIAIEQDSDTLSENAANMQQCTVEAMSPPGKETIEQGIPESVEATDEPVLENEDSIRDSIETLERRYESPARPASSSKMPQSIKLPLDESVSSTRQTSSSNIPQSIKRPLDEAEVLSSARPGSSSDIPQSIKLPLDESVSSTRQTSSSNIPESIKLSPTLDEAAVAVQSLVRGYKGRKMAEKLQLEREREKRKQREIRQQETQKRISASVALESVKASSPGVALDEISQILGVHDTDDDSDGIMVYKAERKVPVHEHSAPKVMHVPAVVGDDEVDSRLLNTPTSARRNDGAQTPAQSSTIKKSSNSGSKLPVKTRTGASPKSIESSQHRPTSPDKKDDVETGDILMDSLNRLESQGRDNLAGQNIISTNKRSVKGAAKDGGISSLQALPPPTTRANHSPRKLSLQEGNLLASISKDIDELDGALSTVFEVEDEDNMDKTGAIVRIKASPALKAKSNISIPQNQVKFTAPVLDKSSKKRSPSLGERDGLPLADDDDQYNIIEDSLDDDEYFELEEVLSRKVDITLFDPSNQLNDHSKKIMDIESRRIQHQENTKRNDGIISTTTAAQHEVGQPSLSGIPSRYAAKLSGLDNMAPVAKARVRTLVSAPPSTTVAGLDLPQLSSNHHVPQHPKSSIPYHRAGIPVEAFTPREDELVEDSIDFDSNGSRGKSKAMDVPKKGAIVPVAQAPPAEPSIAQKRPIVGVRVGGASVLASRIPNTKSVQDASQGYMPSVNDLLLLSPPEAVNPDAKVQIDIHALGYETENRRGIENPSSGGINKKSSAVESVHSNARRQLFGGDDESVRSERSASRERGRRQQPDQSYGQRFEIERERSSSRNRNRATSASKHSAHLDVVGKDKIISKANISRREERVNAATTIQRIFRGFCARINAWRRREQLNQVDRYKCKNCGRLEQGGLYCKGCGRKTTHSGHKKGLPHQQPPQQQQQLPQKQPPPPQQQLPQQSQQQTIAPPRQPKKPSSQDPRSLNPTPSSNVQVREIKPEKVPPHSKPRDDQRLRMSKGTEEEMLLLKELEELDSKAHQKILAMQAAGEEWQRKDTERHHPQAPAAAFGAGVGKKSEADYASGVSKASRKPQPDPEVVKEKLAFKAGAKDVRSAEQAAQLAMKKEEKEKERLRMEQWKRAQEEQRRLAEQEEAAERERIRQEQEYMIEKERREREELYAANKYKSSYLNQFQKKGPTGDAKPRRRDNAFVRETDGGTVASNHTYASSAAGVVSEGGGRNGQPQKSVAGYGRGKSNAGKAEETVSLPPLLPALGSRQIASQGDRSGGKLQPSDYLSQGGARGDAGGYDDSRTKTMSAPPRYNHQEMGAMSPMKSAANRPKEVLVLPPPVRVSHDYGPPGGGEHSQGKKKLFQKR